jgi:hypothetical protein
VRADGVVFLRVWQDLIKKINDRRHTLVLYPVAEGEPLLLGYQERSKHLELVKKGANCVLVMCQAEDIHAIPRKVKDFESENVFQRGSLIEIENEWWIEVGRRVPIREALAKSR